jgi:hypothetical protein
MARLIDETSAEPLRSILSTWLPEFDLDEWWQQHVSASNRLHGRVRLDLPPDIETRTACQLAICRYVAGDDQGFLNVGTAFFFSRSPAEMYLDFLSVVVDPLVRDIGRLAQRRALPSVLDAALARGLPPSGDPDLDELLADARTKFLDRNPAIRKAALERLWDGWERLKSLASKDKRQSAAALLQSAAKDQAFRDQLTQEADTLTKIGNQFHIRHYETDKVPLREDAHVDYLFYRLWAFLTLLLAPRS